MKYQVEFFCGSYYDAKQAEYGGASRILLSHHNYQYGLTPSIGEFIKTKENTDLEIICMLKPRTHGYCYHDDEIETMFLDAEILLDNGTSGIAFGFLDFEKDIDIKQTKKMIDLIHSYHKKAFFNQAINFVDDIDYAMNILITLGIDGVYTKGLQKDIILGKEMIKYLQSAYGEHLEIIPMYSLDLEPIQYMKNTGCYIIQCLCLDDYLDPSTNNENLAVSWERVESIVKDIEEDIYDFELT
ncbi:copper homeostasis protein CutC [Candidatus Stoquefichus massiliensis]|uniref:copper homeostasis protein CutC n=1 Tax=Candidatus Stoquefichus massiliensis TaxID=1470350 RepID=UPI00048741AC|nr:copper homeostasis protein CutC [Candidatus Stoquefichus massiliensis]